MATQTFSPGTFFGSTVAFTTSTTLLGNVKSLKWSGLTRKEVNTTHLLTTNGIETFLAGDIISPGTVDIEVQYSTQLDYISLFQSGKCDICTITFPKRAPTCNGTLALTAATLSFAFVLLSAEPDYNNDDLMMMKFKLQVSGTPTFVAATMA